MPDPTPAEIEAGAQAFAAHFAVPAQAHHRDATEVVLRAVLPDHDARVRRELAEAAEHKWRASTSQVLGDEERQLRVNLATAIVQSGYEDQDDDDPQWWDIVEATACDGCPRPHDRRCGCAGMPWIPDQLWPTLGAAIADHDARVRADERARVAEQIAQRLAAVLADLEHVRAKAGTTHHDACWDEHIGCLATRIRRTLTGEDSTDAEDPDA